MKNKLSLIFLLGTLTALPFFISAQDFDPNIHYRLTSGWQGDGQSLEVVNDGTNNKIQLAPSSNGDNQAWRIVKINNDYFRFTNKSQGAGKSIDVVNDGTNNKIHLVNTGGYSGQYWKITRLSNGHFRMTTSWQGERKSLDSYAGGMNKVELAETSGNASQIWMIKPFTNIQPKQEELREPILSEGYKQCAIEGEARTFSRPMDVAYGVKGKYIYRKGLRGTITFNNETFGDPNPGAGKFGFCKASVVDNPTVVNPDPKSQREVILSEGYKQCAIEGEARTFSRPMDVAYGAQGQYKYRKGLSGTITFNNETFGDPIPGVGKFGFCKTSETVSVDDPSV